ncbi:MAG: phage tail tip lysozyme [Bradymonadia bacterium]|jgi:LysM repeat protein
MSAKSSSLASSKVDFGSKNSNPRNKSISKITIHHMAGNMGAVSCANMHKNGGGASANYYIGSDGSICAGVAENRRAWTSSSGSNDHAALTFEVANNSGAPNWTVSDAAYRSTIALCRDICSRYGISPYFDGSASASLTAHYMFASTACPGPYLKNKLKSGEVAKDIKNGISSGGTPKPPATQNPGNASSGGASQAYTVRSGDTLGGIASRFKVSGGYQALARYNGISNPNRISVGQVIKIPGSSKPAAPTTPTTAPATYTVKPGDTLGAIAGKFKVAGGYQALARHNGISNPNRISVGQVIKIPGGSKPAATTTPTTAPATYTVKPGDTLGAIAGKFKVAGGYQALARHNGISNPNRISVGQVIKIPGGSKPADTTNKPATYTVKSGDTLGAIASRFKVAGGYQALARYNGISNPNRISVGQVIKIPGGSGSTPAPNQTQAPNKPTTPSTPNSGSGYPAIGYHNIRPIYDYLIRECFPNQANKKAIACGFLGNIYTESHYQPDAEQVKGSPDRGGKGIVQWDDRKYNLYQHCGATYEQKSKWASLDKQLTFIKKELFGSENRAYKRMINDTRSNTAQGAKEAALSIARNYERCAVPTNPERQNKAVENFNSL